MESGMLHVRREMNISPSDPPLHDPTIVGNVLPLQPNALVCYLHVEGCGDISSGPITEEDLQMTGG